MAVMRLNWRRMGGIVYRTVVIEAALMLAAFVFLQFITQEHINGYYRAMFPDMIYGRAYRPFVARALLPALTRLIVPLLPSEWKTVLVTNDWRLAGYWEQEYLPEYLVASALMYASLVGFFFALKYLFKGLYRLPHAFVDMVCLAALAALPSFFRYYSYIYDFPTLFLFTLGLGLMIRKRWTPFLILFFFATVNKETSILLTLVFVLQFFRRDKLLETKKFQQLLLAQLAIFFVVHLSLGWIFRNNPGGLVEFHLLDHNILLFTKRPSITGVTIASFLAILIFYKWMEKPAFLRVFFGAILAVLFVTTLFFGFLDEYRDYYEAYPLAVLLIAHSFARLFKLPIHLVTPEKM
jgi:hypothetical protein